MTPQMGAFGQAEVVALIATHATDYSLHPLIVRKTADQIVNNSTVVVDDLELKFTIGANEVWQVLLMPIYNATGGANIKFGWSFPAGATFHRAIMRRDDTNTTNISGRTGATADGWYGAGAPRLQGVEHGIIINGATPGVLQLQWAQKSLDVSDTTVMVNSCIIARRLV